MSDSIAPKRPTVLFRSTEMQVGFHRLNMTDEQWLEAAFQLGRYDQADSVFLCVDKYFIEHCDDGRYWAQPNSTDPTAPERSTEDVLTDLEDAVEGADRIIHEDGSVELVLNLPKTQVYYGAYANSLQEAVDLCFSWELIPPQDLPKDYLKPIASPIQKKSPLV